MTENEKNILNLLYSNPHDQNATDHILTTALGISFDAFNSAINTLVNSGYAREITNANQLKEGLKAYEITVNGSKALHSATGGYTKVVKKYGRNITISCIVFGLIISLLQAVFGLKQLRQGQTEIYLQSHSLHIQYLEYIQSVRAQARQDTATSK